MAKTPVQTQHVDQELSSYVTSFVDLPKIAAPFTTIVNRATVTDFSKDLMPRMGIERFAVNAITEVQGELGPNNEKVFKAINDIHDQIRLVGGSWQSLIDAAGSRPQTSTTAGAYAEITFYGTGLNLLTYQDVSNRTFTVAIDGGSPGSLLNTGNNGAISGRNYNPNVVVNCAAGLTLGLHTAKITAGSANFLNICGYEILNESSNIKTPSGSSYVGGKKLSLTALDSQPYNSNFASGTLSTKGGHVVVYQKADGTIGKAVTPTDATSLTMTSASHTNESVIRSYSWREFGAGRADDFSTLSTTRAASFTLDDGITSLFADSVNTISYNNTDGLRPSTTNNYVVFTFVGTGLDILIDTDGIQTRTYTVTIDGGSPLTGTMPTVSAPSIVRIASGLPYGIHTIKWISTNGAVASTPAILRYITYGPSKPSIPTGAVELCDYYILADYSYSAVDTLALTRSSGTISKVADREFSYSGTWGVGVGVGGAGKYVASNTANDTVTYTFFGTGIEADMSVNTGSPTWQVLLASAGNSLVNLGSTGTVQTTNTGGYSTITSQFTGNSGATTRFSLSGLTLGTYTIQFKLITPASGGNTNILNMNIITPIHAHKSNNPGSIQAILPVGSCAISDNRNFSTKVVKSLNNWSQAIGITSGPTTSSGLFVPLQDMTCVIKTTGNPIEIAYSIAVSTNTISGGAEVICFVDGAATGVSSLAQFGTTGLPGMVTGALTVPVTAGTHIVQIFWSQAGPASTATASSTRRVLKVREIS